MSPNSQNNPEMIYTRLGKLEQENASIATSITNINALLRSLSDDVRNLKENSKPQWGVLASWGSVIFAIMIYHSNMTLQPIKELTVELGKSIEAHKEIEGHPGEMVRHSRTDERLTNLKEDILRERFQLKEDAAKIEHALRREMTLEDKNINNRLDRLEVLIADKSSDRYPRKEAEKDLENIDKRINDLLKAPM